MTTHSFTQASPSLVPYPTPNPFRLPKQDIRLINDMRAKVIYRLVTSVWLFFPSGRSARVPRDEGSVPVVRRLDLYHVSELSLSAGLSTLYVRLPQADVWISLTHPSVNSCLSVRKSLSHRLF